MLNIEKAVRSNQDGAVFDISVIPNSTSCMFPAGYNKWRKKIEIKVNAPPKNNQANKEIITTVATFFNKSVEDILIVSGKKNKNKTILVRDLSMNKAVKLLQESLDEI